MLRLVLLLAFVLFGVAACVRAPRTRPSRPACPAAAMDTRAWREIEDSASVAFRLPAEFTERQREPGAREFLRHGDFQQYVLAGFIESSTPVVAMGRTPHAGMKEMTVCVDSVGGREVLVQAWRTVNGTFREGRRQDRYDVFAVVAIQPELRFYLASGSYDSHTQTVALAAVRTIVIGVAARKLDARWREGQLCP